MSSSISSASFFFFCPSEIPVTCMINCLILSHSFWILCSFFPLSFHFSLDYFYYPVSTSLIFFLSDVQSTDEPVREILHLWYHVFYFCRVHLMFSISSNFLFSHMLSTFSIISFNILITVILRSLYDSFNIWGSLRLVALSLDIKWLLFCFCRVLLFPSSNIWLNARHHV